MAIGRLVGDFLARFRPPVRHSRRCLGMEFMMLTLGGGIYTEYETYRYVGSACK